jgi:hypothetical protein
MNETLKKSLTAIGLSAGMVLSGLAVAQVASAQTTDESTDGTVDERVESDDVRGERNGDCDGEGRHGRRGRHGHGDPEALAETLGLTVDELRAEFEAGNSLSDIAAAQGVDVQDLIDEMVAKATERLDEAVANDNLTREEADAKLAEITERITERVNSVPGEDGEGRGPGRGPRGDGDGQGGPGPRGPRGDGPDGDA